MSVSGYTADVLDGLGLGHLIRRGEGSHPGVPHAVENDVLRLLMALSEYERDLIRNDRDLRDAVATTFTLSLDLEHPEEPVLRYLAALHPEVVGMRAEGGVTACPG